MATVKALTLDLRRLKPAARLVALNDWVTEHVCDYPISGDHVLRKPGLIRYRKADYADGHWCISETFRGEGRYKGRAYWLASSFEPARWSTSLDAVWPLAVKAFPLRIDWEQIAHVLTTVGDPSLDAPLIESRFATLPEALCVAMLNRRGIVVRA